MARFLKNHRKSSRFFCKNEGVSNIGMSKSGDWERRYKGNWSYKGIV